MPEKVKNKFREIELFYKKNGFLRLLTNAIYIRHSDEMRLVKDLSSINKFDFDYKLEVVQFKREHFAELIELCKKNKLGGDRPHEVYTNFLNNNCKCFLAFNSKKLIGFIWWGNYKLGNKFKDPEFKFYRSVINLKRNEAYIFDLFLDESQRGNSNSIEFITKVFQLLKNIGYERAIGFALEENKAARWTYKLLGFEEGVRFKCRRLFMLFLIKKNKIFFDSHGYKNLTFNTAKK